jgi:hypothetical protein
LVSRLFRKEPKSDGSHHEALDHKLGSGLQLTNPDIEAAAIEGAVQRLRSKLMTVTAVLASLIPILFESGIGSDVMKPIAAPIVGGMIYFYDPCPEFWCRRSSCSRKSEHCGMEPCGGANRTSGLTAVDSLP